MRFPGSEEVYHALAEAQDTRGVFGQVEHGGRLQSYVAGIDEQDIRALQRAKSDLTALYRVGQALNALLSSTELCRRAVELIIEQMPAVDCCSLHMLDGNTGELSCRAARFR